MLPLCQFLPCPKCRAPACHACCAADLQRQQIEGLRKADYQALAGAKRSGQLATINFTLDLPDELADVELTERCDRGRERECVVSAIA